MIEPAGAEAAMPAGELTFTDHIRAFTSLQVH